MTTKSSSPKYYPDSRDILKQLPTLLPIALMFVLTIMYASGLQNQTAKALLLYMSLVYPAVILFSLAFSIPRSSYYQVDSSGVYVTALGLFHRRIYWSDIESIGPAAVGKVEAIGLLHVDSFNRRMWIRKARRKMFGWDEILSNAHTKDGASLADSMTEHFREYIDKTGGQHTSSPINRGGQT